MMDNRQHLREIALDLFASRGYDSVGVQEIVDSAGVTKPTLYHHFGNKLGLLREVILHDGQELQALLEQAADYRGDLPLTLQRVVTACFRFASRKPQYFRLLLALWFAPPENEAFKIASDCLFKQYHLFEDLFVNAAEDHGNMRGRSQPYAISFQGMINSTISLSLRGFIPLDDDLEGIAFRAVRQFMHGIYS